MPLDLNFEPAMTSPISSCRYGQKELAAALLQKGADMIGEDEQGRSPLHNAVEQGHEETALLIVEAPQLSSCLSCYVLSLTPPLYPKGVREQEMAQANDA